MVRKADRQRALNDSTSRRQGNYSMPDWYEDLYYEESDNARPWAWNEASKHLGKLDTQEVIALLRDMAGDRTSSLTNLVWFHVMRDRPATEVAEIYEGSMEGINSGSSRLSPMKFAIRDNASIGKAKALEIFRALWERGREPIDGQDVEKGIKDPTRQWPMQLLQVPENETNFQQGSCWTIAVDREFKSAVNADAAVSLANKYIPEYQALSWTKTTESSIPQVDFSRFKRMMDGNHEEYPAANAFSQYLESLPLEQRTAVVNAAMADSVDMMLICDEVFSIYDGKHEIHNPISPSERQAVAVSQKVELTLAQKRETGSESVQSYARERQEVIKHVLDL